MREVRLLLYHDDCPWCSTTEKHTEARIREVTWGVIANRKDRVLCHGVYEITGPREDVDDCNYEIKRKNVNVKLIKRTDNSALVFSRWLHKSSPLAAIHSKGCMSISNVTMENGAEQYHIVGDSGDEVGSALDELKRMGCVKIQRIGDYDDVVQARSITQRQKEALDLAVEHGYYSWPRKVTLDELAKVLGVSRKVYQEHLRKAEAKIVPPLAASCQKR